MKFERLCLRNFQSYDELDIEFAEGLTMIYGPNGAGKSTIARALYTTLYPRFGRNHIGAHKLVDLIQDGEDKATSELVFSVGDDRNRIKVDISRKSDGGASADAEMTILETGETYSTRSTDIEEEVTRLLGMDAKAFANSTYAQQTELNRLIEAAPGDRETILDNLLGLTAPDEHEDDVSELDSEVESWLNDKRSKLQTVRGDIEGLESDDPKATMQSKAEEIEALESRIDELEEGAEEAHQRLRDVEDEIEAYRDQKSDLEERRDDRNQVEETITELEEEIGALEGDIEQATEAIEEHRDRIDELASQADEFDLTTKAEAKAAADHFENEYDEANSTVERERNAVDKAEEQVERLEDELEELESELEGAESRRSEWESEVEEAQEALSEAEEALDESRNERDDLLGDYLEVSLEETDDYEEAVRDRMSRLRDEKSDLETERSTKQDRRERLGDEIDSKQEELSEARARREDIRESLEAQVDDPEAAFEAAVERADERASGLGFSVSPEDIDTVFTGSLPEELEAAIDVHREAANELAGARETIGATTARVEDLRSLADGEWPLDGGDIGVEYDYADDIERLEDEREDAGATAASARQTLDGAEARLEQVKGVAEALFEAASFRALADVAAEIEELESEVETARDTRSGLKHEIETLDSEISSLDSALDQGDAALDVIESVETEVDTVEDAEQELEDAREELADVEEEIEGLDEEIDGKEADIEEARDDIEEAQEELRQAKAELSTATEARDAARDARDAHSEIETLESDRRGYRGRHEDKQNQLADEREELADLDGEIEELEAELGETSLESLRDQKSKVEGIVEELEEELAGVREERDEAKSAKARAEQSLDTLRQKREEKSELEEKISWAQGLRADFKTITDTYEQVQTRMRGEVLDRLKFYTNEVFRDLYQNSTYEAVDIDEGYNLRLVSGSDTSRDPHKASGGEGVLVTIALRAGVYRVLADQAAGRDERLPPFILDEPTNHLDDTHIEQREEAVQSIRDWNVPQVFVVDRYEGLIEGADHHVRVEMDDGDGASKVSRPGPSDSESEGVEAGGDD